jgi:hypothetical protein
MTTRLRTQLGTDLFGTTALNLLRSSLAPNTYANYECTTAACDGSRSFATKKAFTRYKLTLTLSYATLLG